MAEKYSGATVLVIAFFVILLVSGCVLGLFYHGILCTYIIVIPYQEQHYKRYILLGRSRFGNGGHRTTVTIAAILSRK